MVHFTQPGYAGHLQEPYYLQFCSHREAAMQYTLTAIIAIGALIALYTLISVYLGG